MSFNHSSFRCSGPVDRRSWLKIGGLSFGALAGGLQPNLAGLLAAEKSAADAAGSAKPPVNKDFSVILFWANGGPSHLDLFDLKPEAPAEYRGPFQPIRTSVPGMDITEMMPRLASLGEKFALVRSLHHNRNEHSGGTHRFLSGYSSIAANLSQGEYPELGSIVARKLGDRPSDIPMFIANTKFYGGGPAYLGLSAAPYMPSPSPLTPSGNNTYDPVPIYNTKNSVDNLSISSDGIVALNRRSQLLKTLDTLPRLIDKSGMMSSMDVFHHRALQMLSSTRTREAFDLSRETEPTRRRYGHHPHA